MMTALDAGGVFMRGFVPAATAILSLGPQNIFVLRQGLSRRHIMATIVICFSSDVGLMCFALFGLGTVINNIPMVPIMLRRIGCLYLLAGSARMFISAYRGGAGHSTGCQIACLGRILLGAVAVSLLNPLAWIESVLVMGSLATALKAELLATFTVGALAGSLMKFSLLGFGARTLAPLFAHSAFCRAFDAAAAIVMAGMVVLLL